MTQSLLWWGSLAPFLEGNRKPELGNRGLVLAVPLGLYASAGARLRSREPLPGPLLHDLVPALLRLDPGPFLHDLVGERPSRSCHPRAPQFYPLRGAEDLVPLDPQKLLLHTGNHRFVGAPPILKRTKVHLLPIPVEILRPQHENFCDAGAERGGEVEGKEELCAVGGADVLAPVEPQVAIHGVGMPKRRN